MNKPITKSNDNTDALFALIKSLSKSEKRQFNLYVKRLDGNANAKYFALFKLMDKQKEYNESQILESDITSKRQLSNVKAHLYKQILTSLRLTPTHKNIRIQIREQLDFATVLYQKGLYKQSLKLLDKAKMMALEYEEKNTAYDIIELEKIIESQFITRSIDTRADELTEQAKEVSRMNVISSKLSNLSLQLYSWLLKNGYVKDDKELQLVQKYFNDRMPAYDIKELGSREKLWLYKAYLWKSLLTHDFLQSYKYANKWVELFQDNPHIISTHPVFYLKGINYLLESLFFIQSRKKFEEKLNEFEKIVEDQLLPPDNNIEVLTFLYLYSNKIHLHFLNGTFTKGEYLVEIINQKIALYKDRLDMHHIVILYYKIGCLYFGMGKNEMCIHYLSKIIDSKDLLVGEDLQCFARILSLIAHYEAGIDENLESQFKATYRFLIQMKNLQQVQKIFIESIRNLGNLYPHEFKAEFKRVHSELQIFENQPYQKRAFLYLDILSWLESKIENKPVAQIIQEKINQ